LFKQVLLLIPQEQLSRKRQSGCTQEGGGPMLQQLPMNEATTFFSSLASDTYLLTVTKEA
jgi:hypothetical protein